MFLNLLSKVVVFLIPAILQNAFDAIEAGLKKVELAEQSIPDPAQRREAVLAEMRAIVGNVIPDVVLRVGLELVLILVRLGITADKLEYMEKIVLANPLDSVWDEQKRGEILSQFLNTFSDVPERFGQLLLSLVLMKVQAK